MNCRPRFCVAAAVALVALASPRPSPAEDKSPAPVTQPVRPPVVMPELPTSRPAGEGGAGVQVKPNGAVPVTQPAHAQKAGAKVSPDAQAVLDAVRDAYGKLKALDLAGRVSIDADVAGQVEKESEEFTSSYRAPNLFRHDMKTDVTVGSTGDKIYVYRDADHTYRQEALPDHKLDIGEAGYPFKDLLLRQNTSLFMKLCGDAGGWLTEGADEIKKLDDAKVGDQNCVVLGLFEKGKLYITAKFDPQTHLLRAMTIDLQPSMEAMGAQDVKRAIQTIEYTKVSMDATAKADSFAWAPAAGWKELAKENGGAEGSPGNALEGKPAPDFELAGLDGKKTTLAEQKGSVVVLDFWATWCGPCIASLPQLEKTYQANKPAGVKVFIVNLREEPEKVKAFVKARGLTMPVLLDTEQTKAAEKFMVEGIPQTVVIGKDGKVKKVIVGYDPQGAEERLQGAIDAAMK